MVPAGFPPVFLSRRDSLPYSCPGGMSLLMSLYFVLITVEEIVSHAWLASRRRLDQAGAFVVRDLIGA